MWANGRSSIELETFIVIGCQYVTWRIYGLHSWSTLNLFQRKLCCCWGNRFDRNEAHAWRWMSVKRFLFPTSPLILGYETCGYKLIKACQSGVVGNSKFVIVHMQQRSSLQEGCSLICAYNRFPCLKHSSVAMTSFPYLVWATIHMLVKVYLHVTFPLHGSHG